MSRHVKSIIKTTAFCLTDPGCVRSHNEDSCLINTQAGYFLVADGMGGAAAGEQASLLFKETILELCTMIPEGSPAPSQDLVQRAFKTANTKILSHVEDIPAHSGMGCTAELMAFHSTGFVLGHVGDSRSYCLSGGTLEQLTNDHTFVHDQVQQGLLSREQAKNHPMSNLILRFVGNNEGIEVEIIHGTALPGDIFLLCTDGLTDMVEDSQIKEILAFQGPLALKATMLVDQANHNGGKDNITVVLIEVQES